MAEIGELIMGVFAIFFAIVLIVVLAPVLGQLGGGWYEALFVLLAVVIVAAGAIGLAKK